MTNKENLFFIFEDFLLLGSVVQFSIWLNWNIHSLTSWNETKRLVYNVSGNLRLLIYFTLSYGRISFINGILLGCLEQKMLWKIIYSVLSVFDDTQKKINLCPSSRVILSRSNGWRNYITQLALPYPYWHMAGNELTQQLKMKWKQNKYNWTDLKALPKVFLFEVIDILRRK